MQKTTINYEPYGKRHLLPGAMPFIVGALLYATAAVPALPAEFRLPVLIASFAVTVAVATLLAALSASYQRSRIAHWRLVLPPVLLVAGAYFFHLLVGSPPARFITVTVVMLLLFGYVMQLDTLRAGADGAVDKVLRYNRIVSFIGLFSIVIFGFGIRQFIYVPLVVSAAILGVLLFVISYEALLQAEGVPRRTMLLVGASLGLLCAEFFVGLSFLPTPFMVNAVVLLVACFACVRAAVRILRGDLGTRELRIGLATATALVAIVLATAKWN